MDTTTVVHRTIEVPAETTWAAIRGLDGWDRWFPVVHTCTLEGSGIGAVRVMDLGEGKIIHDRNDKLDDATRTHVYRRTTHPFPCDYYLGTVVVSDAGPGRSEVTWTIESDVAPENKEELGVFLHGVITDGLAGLAAELEATAYEATSGLGTTAIIRQAVAAPVDATWAAIRGIDGLDRWFPIIHGCTVKGEGVGALRVLDIGDGAELHDEIQTVDETKRRVVYNRIEHPFPCSRYIGTVDVEPGGHGGSTVFWTIHTDVSAENRAELSAFVFGAISDGLAGMARELEGTPA